MMDLYRQGWRPLIGWVCALSCFYNWFFVGVVKSVIIFTPFAAQAASVEPAGADAMNAALTALLGMSAIRGVEKVKGVA